MAGAWLAAGWLARVYFSIRGLRGEVGIGRDRATSSSSTRRSIFLRRHGGAFLLFDLIAFRPFPPRPKNFQIESIVVSTLLRAEMHGARETCYRRIIFKRFPVGGSKLKLDFAGV